MSTKIGMAVVGLMLATAAPVAAQGTQEATPMRRLPVDGGAADGLMPPAPRPIVAEEMETAARQAYEERERNAKHLEQFRGGEGVSLYIGGGVLTAIAIVALIIILL